MRVARYEVPGSWHKGNPSRRGRYDGGSFERLKCSDASQTEISVGAHFLIGAPDKPIIPCPPGRITYTPDSRHFVPGYLHSVPAGRNATRRSTVCQQNHRGRGRGRLRAVQVRVLLAPSSLLLPKIPSPHPPRPSEMGHRTGPDPSRLRKACRIT
jgi:hypothetical protein